MKKMLLLFFPVLLTGCAAYQQFYHEMFDRVHTDELHYQCDEQPLDVALNQQKEQVSFEWQGETKTLTQGISASGARYSDGIYVFWSKGDDATVYKRDRIILNNCRLLTTAR